MIVIKAYLFEIYLFKIILDLQYTIFVILPVAFILINYSAARWGWSALAQKYKATQSPKGQRFLWVSGYVNQMRYKYVMMLWLTEEGMHISLIFLFKLGHSSLFIPWKDVKKSTPKKIFFQTFQEYTIGHPKVATISFIGKIVESIQPYLKSNKSLYKKYS